MAFCTLWALFGFFVTLWVQDPPLYVCKSYLFSLGYERWSFYAIYLFGEFLLSLFSGKVWPIGITGWFQLCKLGRCFWIGLTVGPMCTCARFVFLCHTVASWGETYWVAPCMKLFMITTISIVDNGSHHVATSAIRAFWVLFRGCVHFCPPEGPLGC